LLFLFLEGRDPLRNIPEQSPLVKRKAKHNSNRIAEDQTVLSGETSDHKTLLRLNARQPDKSIPVITGKARAATLDDEILIRNTASQRPGLKKRPFSAGVGLADFVRQTEELKGRMLGREESLSAHDENSVIDSEYSKVAETHFRPEILVTHCHGTASPNRKTHVVIASYLAEESGEVSLEEGEEFDLLQKESNGWWYVKNDFCEGWAPSAFLAPARSRPPSPETPDQQQVSDSQEESCHIKENLETCPKEQGVDQIKFAPQGKEKSPDKNVARQAQTMTTEMNRRAKFLTVEGIQKRKNPDKNYVYIVKVVWSDGNINIIYRTCSDFFFLQENLRKEFPTAIGKEIPALKGRKFNENCQLCFKDGTCKRQKFMNQFCHELINAPDNISKSKVVMDFCRSRASDVHSHGKATKKDGKSPKTEDNNVEISAPMMFEQYVVTADYQKKNKNDISLKAGDIIDVIERNDYGWWLVDREGELGWAPASHLEPTDNGSEITTSKVFAPGKEEIYMSLESYQAKADDELTFDADVMLKVVEKTLDGWWLVRYQGEEGWAPAMLLKRVNSDESSTSMIGGKDPLDTVSFTGDSEDGDSQRIQRRTTPTRRSMVQRPLCKSIPDGEDGNGETIITSGPKSSPSVPVADTANTPPMNRMDSMRSTGVSLSSSLPQSRFCEFNQGEVHSPFQTRQFSVSSSGYESSLTGSFSSLVSPDALNEEDSTNAGIKKCATYPRFDTIEGGPVLWNPSPGMLRSKSPSSMEHDKNEMGLSLNDISSTSRISRSERNSPVPFQRKISASGMSQFTSCDSGSVAPLNTSPRESNSEINNESDQNESTACQRFYRAMYSYDSAGDGEVAFREGDEVEVIQRSENGWWLVRTSEKVGWGPSNFLESLSY